MLENLHFSWHVLPKRFLPPFCLSKEMLSPWINFYIPLFWPTNIFYYCVLNMVKLRSESTGTPMADEEESNQENEADTKPNTDDAETEPIKTKSTRGRKPKAKPQVVSASVASVGTHRVFYLSGIFLLCQICMLWLISLWIHAQMISANQPSTWSSYICETHALVNHLDTSANTSKTNISNCWNSASHFDPGSSTICSPSMVPYTSPLRWIRCSWYCIIFSKNVTSNTCLSKMFWLTQNFQKSKPLPTRYPWANC